VFALFAQFIDFAFGLLEELRHFRVLFAFAVFVALASFAIGHRAAVLIQFFAGALSEGFGLVDLAMLAQGVDLLLALLEPRFEFARLTVAFTVGAPACGPIAVAITGSLSLAVAGFVAVAVAGFVVVEGPCGPSETHADNDQRGQQGNPFLHGNAFV